MTDEERLRAEMNRLIDPFVERFLAAGRDQVAQEVVLEDLQRVLETMADHPRLGLSAAERAAWTAEVDERVHRLRVMLAEPPVWN